jgi:hypothetical protein
MIHITLAATFNIDPAKEVMNYWLGQFLKEFDIQVHDDHRVLEYLLEASDEENAISIIAICFEDFCKEPRYITDEYFPYITKNTHFLVNEIIQKSMNSKRQFFLAFCLSPYLNLVQIKKLEDELTQKIQDNSNIKVIPSIDILNLFNIKKFFHEYEANFWKMPLSKHGYVSLGTCISKELYAFLPPNHKIENLERTNLKFMDIEKLSDEIFDESVCSTPYQFG